MSLGTRDRLTTGSAYAGTSYGGFRPSASWGIFGSRRNRFWFGVLGLVALALPYASLVGAAIRSVVDPPATVVPVPEVALPSARFPVLEVPKLVAPGIAHAPAASPSPATGLSRVARSTGSRMVPQRTVRRMVSRPGAATAGGTQVPVIRHTYSLVPPAPKKTPHSYPSSGTISALAQALAAAPVVTNTAPGPPSLTTPPPIAVTLPTDTTPTSPAGSAPTVSVTTGTAQQSNERELPRNSHVVAHTAEPSLTSSTRATTDASGAPAPTTSSTAAADPTVAAVTTDPSAQTATDTTTAAPASTTAAAPADTATTPAPADTTTTASSTDTTTSAPPANTTTIPAPTDTTTAAPDPQPTQLAAPSTDGTSASQSSSVAPQPASLGSDNVAPTSSQSTADTNTAPPASTATTGSAAPTGTSGSAPGSDPSAPATVAPQPVQAVDLASAPRSLQSAPTQSEIAASAVQDLQSAEGNVAAPRTIASETVVPQSPIVAPAVTVAGAPTMVLAGPVAGTVSATGASSPTDSAGATSVSATDPATGTVTLTDSSQSTTPQLIAGSDSPSAVAATIQSATGATTSPDGTLGSGSASIASPPDTTALALAAPQTDTSTVTGTLGARGPPYTYGPVLIVAATGGSINAGDATLTFAPGSLPHDAYVTVTVTAAPADGLIDYSAAYNLTAVNTATGELIEQFAAPPQLTINVGAAGAEAPAIYYLAPTGDPVPISSSFDAATGTVSAGLPHFSTYVAASQVSDFLATVGSVLASFVGQTGPITKTVSLGSLRIGGVMEIDSATLSFSISSITGTGSSAQFTGSVTTSAASGGIAVGDFNASFGAVSGWYTLAGQTAGDGTINVTIANPQITIANLVTLGATSIAVTSQDNGTATQTELGAVGVTATVTAGTGPTLTVSNAMLGLVAQLADSGGTAPAFALLSTGNVGLSGAGPVTFTGTNWQVEYDALGDLSSTPISVPTGSGTPPVVINFAQPSGVSGKWTSIQGTGSLTVAGTSLNGQFVIAASGSQLAVTASNLGLSLGSYVTVSGGHGTVVVSGAGTIADLATSSVTLNLPDLSPASLTNLSIQVNTESTAVVDPTTGSPLPAGPYVQVAATIPQTPIIVGTSTLGQVQGNLLVQQETVGGATTTVLALSGASIWIGSATTASVFNGQGVLVVSPAGLAGYVSGTAQVSGGGASGSGDVLLQINTTGGAVNASVVLGGQPVTISYGASQGNLFALSISNLALNIDNIVTIEGTISTSTFTDPTNNIAGQDFAGTGLTLFFGDGPAMLASGSPNPLAIGVEITNATLALFTDGNGNYAVSANGSVALVGTGSVTASGQGTILVNTFQKLFNDTIAIPGGSQTVPLVLGSGQAASASAPFFSVGGTGISFNILGQTLSGNITVTDPSGTIEVNVSMAQVSLSDGNGSVSSRGPPIAQLTNGSGEIDISSAGVTGGLAGTVTIAPPGATLTGTFQLLVNTTAQSSSVTLSGQSTSLPAGPYVEFSAPGSGMTAGATLTIGSQTLTGDFTLQQSTTGGVTTTIVTVSNASLSIVSGTTTLLAVNDGQGTLIASTAGVVGSLTASVSTAPAGPLGGLSVNALTIAVNTTPTAAQSIPAGPFFGIEAQGATLTVAGQTVTGNFGVEVSTAAGSPVVIAAVSNATASLGGGIAVLTGGSGALVVSGSGVAASFTGTFAINVPGVSITGTLAIQVNSTSATVNTTFTVGANGTTINLPGTPAGSSTAAPYVQVSGTGLTLSVGGQTLAGDFTFTSGSGAVTITLANVSLGLGNGNTNFVNVSNGAGSLTLIAGGVYGEFGASVAIDVPGVAFSGTLQVEFNTTGAPQPVGTNPSLPSGTVEISGTGVQLTVAGVTMGADSFTITVMQASAAGGGASTETAVEISVTNLTLSFGTFVNITKSNALSGAIIVDGNGVAAQLSATNIGSIFTGLPSGVTIGSAAPPPAPQMTVTLEINTGSGAVDETIGNQTINVPAGPYLEVQVLNAAVTISSNVVSGSFAFEQQGSGATAETVLAATGVSVAVGTASLSNGQGVLVLTTKGIAGYVSGTGAGTSGGVSISGTVLLQINTTGGAVNASVMLGGQPVTIDYSASQGTLFSLSISNLSLNIDNVVTIEGTISYSTITLNGISGKDFAGTGLTLFFGNGPAQLSNGDPNPLAVGLEITNATVALFTDGNGNYALNATGTVQLVGTGSVTASGQGTIQVNTFTTAFTNITIALPGSGGQSLPLDLPGAPTATTPFYSVGALGLNLNIFGQTLSGDVTVTDPNGTIEVNVSNAQVSLSDGNGSVSSRGPPFAQLTNGSGEIDISSAGVAASVSGSVAFTLPSVSLTGTFSLQVNTTAQAMTLVGTPAITLPAGPYFQLAAIGPGNTPGATLTVGGQSLSGNFTITQSTVAGATTTTVTISNGALTIAAGGTTYLSLTGGQGSLTISPAGIVGSLSATVQTIAIPGVTLSSVAIALNTTSTAAQGIPAGPFFGVEANGASVSITGQTLTANLAIQVSTGSGGGTLVAIAVTNASASFGGGLATLSNGSGALLVSSGGVAGTFTGTITLNVPGVSISGTLSVQVNTSTQAVPSTQFTVGGQSVVVSLPAGQFIQVSGTGVQISVLGQTLSGNVTLTAASGTTKLVVSNASLSLAGGAVSVTGVGGNVTLDAGGATGNITGSLSIAVPNVSVSVASVTVNFDTHSPSSFSVLAGDATVTIAGQQLVGNLSIAQGTDSSGNPAVLIAFENEPTDNLGNLLTLGPTGGPAFLTIANGSGELLITAQGVAGDLHLTGVTVALPGGLKLGTGAFELQVSTLPTAVSQQFTVPASPGPGTTTETLSLPAGPYVSVSVQGVALTISSSASLMGNFLFQEQGTGSSAVTVIAVSQCRRVGRWLHAESRPGGARHHLRRRRRDPLRPGVGR